MQLIIQNSVLTQIILWFASSFHKSEEQISDEQRMVEAAQQNPDHFAPIYDLYYDHIFTFVIKRVGEETTTAEITAEVFYKALYNIRKYKFKGLPFSAWLYRIASNNVAEYYRKHKKVQRHISIDSDHLINLVSEVSDESDFEKQLQLLLSMLSRLQEKEIQLIELRFFEERSFKEVREILGLTENNAKVKTFRVIQKMQKIANR